MPDTRVTENPYDGQPAIVGTVARGMAHDLTTMAQHFLSAALRLDGTHTAMHPNAEFQGLDMALADFHRRLVVYRAALVK